ncbi:hypothetical protein F4820DRAFT_409792 [Hypoxylon rubiginosum]|uniref:Uncharacterized protein n=1 Tax=Hypoxylon rubiginosum TaxID=110542 RepID=A0ACB9ZB21_9PEZI|nr:hypothetical protein F4820DRAFT_409792 [Hypoxylon rubiginosum]
MQRFQLCFRSLLVAQGASLSAHHLCTLDMLNCLRACEPTYKPTATPFRTCRYQTLPKVYNNPQVRYTSYVLISAFLFGFPFFPRSTRLPSPQLPLSPVQIKRGDSDPPCAKVTRQEEARNLFRTGSCYCLGM